MAACAVMVCVSLVDTAHRGGYDDGHSSMDYHRDRNGDHGTRDRLADERDSVASPMEAEALPAAGRSGAAADAGGADAARGSVLRQFAQPDLAVRWISGHIDEVRAALWVADRSPMSAPARSDDGIDGAGSGAQMVPGLSEGGWIDGIATWREIVSRYFPPAEVEKALRVSYCESHWADKYDESGAHVGRFQIAWRWHQSRFGHPDELLDPETNARVAAAIWRDNSGWAPWPYCGLR